MSRFSNPENIPGNLKTQEEIKPEIMIEMFKIKIKN